MKPRLLDLFSGAGGSAMGYARAGFEVVGIDIARQPNYPFEFHQHDVFVQFDDGIYEAGFGEFDAIHASPPCQAWTAYKRTGNVGDYPELIEPVRERLEHAGVPYVIENVAGAPLRNPVLICDSMFDPPNNLQRHRYFETNWPLRPPNWPCRHKLNGPDRFPGGRSVSRGGVSTHPVRATMEIGSWDIPLADQQRAMGIDWMTLEELSEAIPPRYTEFIGAQLFSMLGAEQ